MNSISQQPRTRRVSLKLLRALCFCGVVLAGFGLLSCAKTPPASQPEPASAFAPEHTQSVEPVRSETVNRIYTRTCSACHGPDGHGIAAVAPDLRRAKARSFAQWQQYLGQTNGHPGAQMPPPTWLNMDEIDVMANYLITLTQSNATPTPEPSTR